MLAEDDELSVHGDMVLIRSEDVMWRLVGMRVDVLNMMIVEIVSTDGGGDVVRLDKEENDFRIIIFYHEKMMR